MEEGPMPRWRDRFVIVAALCLVACGDDGRRGGAGDGGTAVADGAARDGAMSDAGATPERCNGTACPSGQLCCAVRCDGTLGCTAPDDGDCPLLGCPPPPVGTPCGGDTCDPATEICIEGDFGGPTSISCEPVPPGCETDRGCGCVAATYCTVGLAMCTETSDNHIFCETGYD
jgi:hypothetical protein